MRRTLFLALLTATACGSSPTAPTNVTLSDLRAASTIVTLGGKTLNLDADVIQQMISVGPPPSAYAVLSVRASDGSTVPAVVRADTVWMVFGDQVWSGTANEEQGRADTAPAYEVTARNAPRWGPDVLVDVVVRLTDSTGTLKLLRVANRRIQGVF